MARAREAEGHRSERRNCRKCAAQSTPWLANPARFQVHIKNISWGRSVHAWMRQTPHHDRKGTAMITEFVL